MDPVSIATGAASLATTCTRISFFLYRVINATRKVHSTLAALCNEINSLSGLLDSVSNTLQNCQPLALQHVDAELWCRIHTSLEDCKSTLESLEKAVDGVQGTPETAAILKTRPALQIKLSLRSDDIIEFRERIRKCNCAMQMAFQVINVSLSLRSSNSQDLIFQELQGLKSLVELSLQVSLESRNSSIESLPDATTSSNSKISSNLRDLARAAQVFHSSASSTASTVAGSEAGDFTEFQRERIEGWRNDLGTIDEALEDRSESFPMLSPMTSSQGPRSVTSSSEESDSDFEKEIIANMESLARISIQKGDFKKAESLLRKGLDAHHKSPSNTSQLESLSIQLACVYCAQDKWEDAELTLSQSVKLKTCKNVEAFYILQAVSLAHAKAQKYDAAYVTGKAVVRGLKRHFGKHHLNYFQALGFLANILEKKGDHIEAEALRLTMPHLSEDLFEDTPHEYLRRVIDDTREDKPRSSEFVTRMPKIHGDAWKELILAPKRDGVVIAEHYESSSKELGEMDTGKEVWNIENNFVMADAIRLNLPVDLSSVFWNESPPEFLDPFIRRTAGREVTFAKTLFQTTFNNPFRSRQGDGIEDNNGRRLGELDTGKAGTLFRTASNNPFRRRQEDGIEDNNRRQLGELDTGKEVTVSIFQDDTMKEAASATSQWTKFENLDAVEEYKGHGAIKVEWRAADMEQPLSNFSPSRPRKLKKAIDMRHVNDHYQQLSDQAGKPLISKVVAAINRLPANHRPTRVMGLNFELDGISSAIVPRRGHPLLLTYEIGDQNYEWEPAEVYVRDRRIIGWGFRTGHSHDQFGHILSDVRAISILAQAFQILRISRISPSSQSEILGTLLKEHVLRLFELLLLMERCAPINYPETEPQHLSVSVPDVFFADIGEVITNEAHQYFNSFTLAPQSFTTALYFAEYTDWVPSGRFAEGRALILNCGWILLESAVYMKILDDTGEPLLTRVWGPSSTIGGLFLTLKPFRELVESKLNHIAKKMKLKQDLINNITTRCEEDFKTNIIYEFRADGRDWPIKAGLPPGLSLPDVQNGSLTFKDKEIHAVMLTAVQIIVDHCMGALFCENSPTFSYVFLAGESALSDFVYDSVIGGIEAACPNAIVRRASDCVNASTIGTPYAAGYDTGYGFLVADRAEVATTLHGPDLIQL